MTRALLGALVLALAGTACAHADPAATGSAANPAAASSTTSAHPAGMCPMSVPETKVLAADTATGESLTFTTTSDQVSVLREKVRAMSEMHNRHQASGDVAQGGVGSMGGMMAGMPMPPPSRTSVEDLHDGARIIMTPVDPADLQRLQATVRTRAEQMQQNGCGMMQHS
jgi:hypothetical protein